MYSKSKIQCYILKKCCNKIGGDKIKEKKIIFPCLVKCNIYKSLAAFGHVHLIVSKRHVSLPV